MTSTIPAAIDALIVVLSAYSTQEGHALYGVQILDGPPLDPSSISPDVVAVGFDPDRVSVQSQQASAGLSNQTESYDIACMASAWRGDEALKPVRDRAFAVLAAVDTAIAADGRTLGDSVLDARVQLVDVDQQQASDGTSVTVAFTVRVSAFA